MSLRHLEVCIRPWTARGALQSGILSGTAKHGGADFYTARKFTSKLALSENGAVAGASGRSSVSGVVATVFGSTGFIGRYVVNALGKIGSQVIVPYRCQENEMMHLKPMGDLGQIVPLRLSIRDELAVRAAVRESSVVINLVGEERETWNWRFKEVHAVFPTTLARICAETPSVERFVHVSSIAASATAPSWRERSRYEGEAGVLQHFPDATVIRLADVVGPEDRFFNRMATLIKGMPRVALVDGGRNRVQPVWVHDVVAGFRRILELESSKGKTYEFAGPATYSMAELVDAVQDVMREPKRAPLPLPGDLLMPVMGALQRFMLRNSLPSYMVNSWYTEDGIKQARVDAVRAPGSLGLEDLQVVPQDVMTGRPIEHVRFYRTGGYTLGQTRLTGDA